MKSGLSRVLHFSRQNQTPSFHLHLHLLNAPLFVAATPESASEDLDSLFSSSSSLICVFPSQISCNSLLISFLISDFSFFIWSYLFRMFFYSLGCDFEVLLSILYVNFCLRDCVCVNRVLYSISWCFGTDWWCGCCLEKKYYVFFKIVCALIIWFLN